MADEYSLTSRFKVPVPAENNTNWLDLLTHWAELFDVMTTVLANQDYVVSGLSVTTDPVTLEFTYDEGVASINGSTVSVTSGAGSLVANSFNWVYLQSGQVKVSTYPPSGASFVPIASIQTNDDGAVGPADLRVTAPGVNGVSIAPYQVNPTGDVNLAAGKRLKHTDGNVGSNILLYPDSERVSIVNWGNQTAAKAWQQIDVSTYLPATAKFAILNLRLATLNADTEGWALLEVRTSEGDTEYIHFVNDYGHGAAAPLNSPVWGASNEIILKVDDEKKFWVRSLVNNLGGTGAYYAFVQLLGYVE
jgi:hypothetical protein